MTSLKTRYIFTIRTLILGLCLLQLSQNLFAQRPSHDLLITEIFPDPTPSLGLPEKEFVEIYNNTPSLINLQGYQLCDLDKCYTLPSFSINPNTCVIVCKTSDISSFSSFGATIGINSFISLNNDGDEIFVKDNRGEIINSVVYTSAMVKEGRTLERTDLKSRCSSQTGWMTTKATNGGTPGKITAEQLNPAALKTVSLTGISLVKDSIVMLQFDSGIDHYSLPQLSIIKDDENTTIDTAYYDASRMQLSIVFPKKFFANFQYDIKINGLKDCFLNDFLKDTTLILAIPDRADSMDIVLNEILFNPKSGGVDFVEICLTNPQKIVDLKDWKLANIDEGVLINIKSLSTVPLIVSNTTPIAFTPNLATLNSHYTTGKVYESVLPSFNDDRGSVVLVNPEGKIMDRFDYSERMHFEVLKDVEGISLERIYLKAPSNDPINWHSASEQAGFATPGMINSQSKDMLPESTGWKVVPVAFNPYGGSDKDFATIYYQVEEFQNSTATLQIYDAEGRNIKTVAKNTTLSSTGFLKWDGTNDEGRLVNCGQYVLFIQTVDMNGDIKEWKKQVVITSF